MVGAGLDETLLFNSLPFLIFIAVTLVGYWVLPGRRAQNRFLLALSLFFYGYADPIFLSLIVLCIATGYLAGRVIERFPGRARLALIGSTLICLGTLFVFKYFDFFVNSFADMGELLGFSPARPLLELALPVGISFFTFQTFGYVMDCYRGECAPEHDPLDFALFVTFFPQLVAGPVERATHLLPQLKQPRRVKQEDVLYGLHQIAQGYVKKVVVADNLAPFVELIFSEDDVSGPLVAAGVIAFTAQIYCDFSGYTDIARGVSRVLGIRILLNFNHPYGATNPTEFWRRWHITLSTWFRDYLYVPLGGNRKGKARTYVNIVITMVVSGIWHGAAWNFLLWGLFHGLLVSGHKLWMALTPQRTPRKTLPYRWVAHAATLVLVMYGWLLFRVESGTQLLSFSGALFGDFRFLGGAWLLFLQMLPYLGLLSFLDIVEHKFVEIQASRFIARPIALGAYLAFAFWMVLWFGSRTGGDFIYFRF